MWFRKDFHGKRPFFLNDTCLKWTKRNYELIPFPDGHPYDGYHLAYSGFDQMKFKLINQDTMLIKDSIEVIRVHMLEPDKKLHKFDSITIIRTLRLYSPVTLYDCMHYMYSLKRPSKLTFKDSVWREQYVIDDSLFKVQTKLDGVQMSYINGILNQWDFGKIERRDSDRGYICGSSYKEVTFFEEGDSITSNVHIDEKENNLGLAIFNILDFGEGNCYYQRLSL